MPQDMSLESTRKAQPTFSGLGPSPSPAQYSVSATGHIQQTAPFVAGHTIQQTPVPIPQPPQTVSSPQVAMRPMQYHQQQPQQGGYAQNIAPTYGQQGATFTQPTTNSSAIQYNQQLQGRGQLGAAAGSVANPANVYNPPRPPEVYTLPDNINDALHPEIRQGFQHDSGGRVLFFGGPPLDRPHKRLSPQSAMLGHSIKYLAGREAWLVEREKKRRRRDELKPVCSEISVSPDRNPADRRDNPATQAANALGQWFQRFNEEFIEQRHLPGLER